MWSCDKLYRTEQKIFGLQPPVTYAKYYWNGNGVILKKKLKLKRPPLAVPECIILTMYGVASDGSFNAEKRDRFEVPDHHLVKPKKIVETI